MNNKLVQVYTRENQNWGSKNIRNRTAVWPSIPVSGFIPKGNGTSPVKRSLHAHSQHCFWQPGDRSYQCLLKDEWTKENAVYMRVHVQTKQYYLPIKRRKSLHLWKRAWTRRTLGWDRHKRQYCTISCVCGDKKKKSQTQRVLGWAALTRWGRGHGYWSKGTNSDW